MELPKEFEITITTAELLPFIEKVGALRSECDLDDRPLDVVFALLLMISTTLQARGLSSHAVIPAMLERIEQFAKKALQKKDSLGGEPE